MKKTKMTLCGIAAALLAVALVACGTGAPAARQADDLVSVLATGEWFAMDDQGAPDFGSSTAEMTEIEIGGVEAFHIAGEVTDTFQWGFAGFGIHPDAATVEMLRVTEAISFMVRGDGQRYSIQFQTSDVRDYGFFWVLFDTEADEAVRITIPMRNFMQPGWASPVGRLRQDRVTGLQWQTHESWRPGPFELSIWDVRLYVPAGTAIPEVAAAVAPVDYAY
ncbi:MAG: CIA30 family protein [Treponema sp.]|nr:CIA30 family protein [Treponema sp.]